LQREILQQAVLKSLFLEEHAVLHLNMAGVLEVVRRWRWCGDGAESWRWCGGGGGAEVVRRWCGVLEVVRSLGGGAEVPRRWFIDPARVGQMSQINLFFTSNFQPLPEIISY